jgi:hypothetical protein
MKNKIQQLIKAGLSKELLKNLSEGQVNQLHKRMISEQVKGSVVVKKDTDPTQIKSYTDKGINVTMVEKEIDEDDTLDVVNDPDATEDGMGMFETEIGEGKKKKSKYNPYAICTSSVGRKDKEKYEKCVMDVKKNIREGKNPHQVIVEMALEKMVEKHISPRMTKKDLVNTLSEQGIIRRPMANMTMGFVNDGLDNPLKNVYSSKKESMEQKTKEAPTRVKPGTKEKEKPGKMDPFKNPKHQPKPKAKKDIEEQATKTAPPVVKPGTKEKPKTSDPFKNPKHQPKPKALDKPAKKMGTVEIPDYLTFDQLKINFKDQ